MAERQIHAPEKGTEEKRAFPKKMGMLDRWRQKRLHKSAAKLLNAAMQSTNGTARGKLDEAAELFMGMDPEKQHQTLDAVEKLLKPHSRFCWESEFKAHAVHAVAEFLIKVADSLPKDKDGDPIMDKHMPLLYMIEDIIDTTDPDGLESRYAAIRNACTRALWELAYPSTEFWERRILDPVTSDFAIGAMLEMEPKEVYETSGWHLLEENLREVDLAVAVNPSPKKVAFAKRLLESSEPRKIATALRMACYMREHHAEFMGEADRYIIPQHQSGMEHLVEDIRSLKQKMAKLGKRCEDIEALLRFNEEIAQLTEEEIKAHKDPMPILSDEEKEEAKERLVSLMEEMSDLQGETDSKMERFSNMKLLWDHAHDFENVRVFSLMLDKRETISEGLNGLLMLWHSGRDYLTPMLAMIYNGLQDDYHRVTEAEQSQAVLEGRMNVLLLLGQMEAAGIGNPVANRIIVSMVDEMLDRCDADSHGALRTFSLELGNAIAMSRSRKRDQFILGMMHSGDIGDLRLGLEISLNVEEGAEALDTAVAEIYEYAQTDEEKTATKIYLHVRRLQEQLAMADDIQFRAAAEIIRLYSNGGTYLRKAIAEVGQEMVEHLKDPDDSEEGRRRKQEARKVVDQLAAAGVYIADLPPDPQPMSEQVPQEIQEADPQAVQDVLELVRASAGDPAGEATLDAVMPGGSESAWVEDGPTDPDTPRRDREER